MILWGMGISQHVHGTDNARCLIALTLMTGQIGRPGTGLHPLRGQNNVQGASDSGLIPMMFPDYQRVDNPEANARFEKLWGTTLDTKPGLTVVEIMDAAYAGKIRGMYMMGENPAMSDPDVGPRARGAWRSSSTSSCRTSSSPRPAISPTWSCRRRRGRRRTAPSPTPTAWCSWAGRRIEPPGRGEGGPLDPQRARAPDRPRLELQPSARSVQRNAQGHEFDRRHHLGAPGAGLLRDLPLRKRGRSRPVGGVHRDLPDATGRAKFVPGGPDPGRRASRRGLSVRADHRPPARALAHRGDDAARHACSMRSSPNRSARSIRWISTELGAKPGDVITVESRRGKISLYARADEARRAARCSSRSRSTRRRRTGSPIPSSIRSARSRSSSTARSSSGWAEQCRPVWDTTPKQTLCDYNICSACGSRRFQPSTMRAQDFA